MSLELHVSTEIVWEYHNAHFKSNTRSDYYQPLYNDIFNSFILQNKQWQCQSISVRAETVLV
jgi:hypothetical protein